MPSDVHVAVSNPCSLDHGLFLSWLQGYSVDQLIKEEAERLKGMDFELVRSYVLTQYRNFEMFRHFLHHPVHFPYQSFFTFPEEILSFIVERYYQFNDEVMRFLLGKKLNSRLKKDLDELSESTGISLASCRRQFDNLKRIYKAVEESENVPYLDTIVQQFFLPSGLANQYARILFISENRIDTSRRRLEPYSFSDFDYCAWAMISFWTEIVSMTRSPYPLAGGNFTSTVTVPSTIGSINPSPRRITSIDRSFTVNSKAQFDFDVKFVQTLRDIRGSLFGKREIMDEYCQHIQEHADQIVKAGILFGDRKNVYLSGNVLKNLHVYRMVISNGLNIGASLLQSKEFKDIFLDLIEKIVDPCKEDGKWNVCDVELFFASLLKAFPLFLNDHGVGDSESDRIMYIEVFEEFMTGLMLCVLRLYEKCV